jgi:hypothetical protein
MQAKLGGVVDGMTLSTTFQVAIIPETTRGLFNA